MNAFEQIICPICEWRAKETVDKIETIYTCDNCGHTASHVVRPVVNYIWRNPQYKYSRLSFSNQNKYYRFIMANPCAKMAIRSFFAHDENDQLYLVKVLRPLKRYIAVPLPSDCLPNIEKPETFFTRSDVEMQINSTPAKHIVLIDNLDSDPESYEVRTFSDGYKSEVFHRG